MPIFEYRCLDCGNVSEFLVGVGDGEVRLQCTGCGSGRLEKIFSRYAVTGTGRAAESRHGKTCCGRDEVCGNPPCGTDGRCTR
jgi:putative FmdB family regulatory protein